MGRGRRLCFPGAFFHCINRGNRREQIFCEEEDYGQMLKSLGDVCNRYEARIHGFCLIPNHFHVLLQQQELSVSSAMRSLGTRYARYFNQKYHKTGHVFQGRFRGILCDQRAYLLALIRYLHLNPVRAGLVEQAQDWKWSSLPAYLGLIENEWLYQKDVLALFGSRPRQRLLEFLSQAPGLAREQIYPVEAWSIMGNEEFVQQVTSQGEPRRGRRREYTGRKLPLQKLSEILCQAAGLSLEQVCFRGKGARSQSEVREGLIHVATRIMFYTTAEVARFLRITTSAITHANHRFDSRLRRNPNLADELIALLMEKK